MTTVNVNPIQEITNIEERTAERQISFVQENSPNLNNLVKVFAEEIQEVHSRAVIPMLYQRTLDRAEGVNLDNLGELLEIPRQGLSDNQYRVLIRVITASKRSQGTVNDILDIVYNAFGDRNAIYSKGFDYQFDLGISVCPDVSLGIDRGTPPFGFEGNPHVEGYNSANLDTQGRMSSRTRVGETVNQIIINQLIRSFPVISRYKLLSKSTTPFGFQGNPQASGYSSTSVQAGHMSALLQTNRN